MALVKELNDRADNLEALSERLRWQDDDEEADRILLLAFLSRMDAEKVEKL